MGHLGSWEHLGGYENNQEGEKKNPGNRDLYLEPKQLLFPSPKVDISFPDFRKQLEKLAGKNFGFTKQVLNETLKTIPLHPLEGRNSATPEN